MSKPVQVTDPVTGAVAYTKHPERLIRRRGAEHRGPRVVLPNGFAQRLADAEADAEFARNRGPKIYWNGALGSDKAFPPGCNVQFRKPGRGLDRRS